MAGSEVKPLDVMDNSLKKGKLGHIVQIAYSTWYVMS